MKFLEDIDLGRRVDPDLDEKGEEGEEEEEDYGL